jgi:tyrosyl-tRNA synthetase
MQAKKNLAWGIVRDFQSAAAADAAAESWAKQFQQRAVAEDAPLVKISLATDGLVVELGLKEGSVVRLPKLLQLAGLAASTGEATRKIAENAVSVDGEKFGEKLLKGVNAGGSVALRLGKKSARVEWVR